MEVARIVLVAGLLAAPLALGAVVAWAWAGLTTLAAVVLILWGVEQGQQGRVRVFWSPLLLPPILFLAVAVVQFHAGLSFDRIATREAVIKLAMNFLLFFLAMQLFAAAPKSVWRGLVTAVTVFAFALSLLAILQYFSGRGMIYWMVETTTGRSFGPYVNCNHYAGLMEMLIPVAAVGVLSRQGNHPLRALFGFAVVVALASVLLSGSRGGLIALMAEMVILGAILARFSPRRGVRSARVIAALGLVASATLFFLIDPGQVSNRLRTIADIPFSPETTLANRTLVIRDAYRMFVDHPWVGVGLGSFEVAYPRYQSFATDLIWDHAHNDYAEALAETGAVGGILIVAALAMFFASAFGRLRERLEHEVGWIQIGAAVGCCGLLVHSLGDFNLHIPANAAWFAVSAALATPAGTPAQAMDVLVNSNYPVSAGGSRV